jgi:predicted ATPase
VLVERIEVNGPVDLGAWPFTVPAIQQLARQGIAVTSPILVLVGANGSGKSTLIEAIAESYGIDVRGGHGGRQYGTTLGKSELGQVLRLARTPAGHAFIGRNAKGFFLRAETAAGMLEFMTNMNVRGYGEAPSESVSHGESYLQAIIGRFEPPGLFLLDEADHLRDPLAPHRCVTRGSDPGALGCRARGTDVARPRVGATLATVPGSTGVLLSIVTARPEWLEVARSSGRGWSR